MLALYSHRGGCSSPWKRKCENARRRRCFVTRRQCCLGQSIIRLENVFQIYRPVLHSKPGSRLYQEAQAGRRSGDRRDRSRRYFQPASSSAGTVQNYCTWSACTRKAHDVRPFGCSVSIAGGCWCASLCCVLSVGCGVVPRAGDGLSGFGPSHLGLTLCRYASSSRPVSRPSLRANGMLGRTQPHAYAWRV